MKNVHDSADMTVIDTDGCVVDPQASLLIEALSGCIHPRAARLTARLADRPDNEQLTRLRAEVLNLLALSFGLPEAERRLQAVQ